MARFDDAFLQEVRDRNDIVAVVGEYVHLTRRGSRYWGLCPFHSEKTPSFTVNPEGQFYYCFGCKASGDVIRFIMEKERLSFPEAVAFLAQRARIPLPRPERSPAEEQAAQERQQVLAALEFAARFYEYQLRHTPAGQEALRYLLDRGLTPETIARFRLGYAPDGGGALLRAARQRFPEAVLVQAGLVVAREGGGYADRFRHRAMFPICDIRGRVVGFGGRALRPDQVPKYYNSPEGAHFSKRLHLYALHLARDAMRAEDLAIIVEGYMDAVALHQAGFPMAVASMGTSLTREHAELLRRQCQRVVIAYDADAAGQQATLRGLEVLAAAGCDVRVLRVPDGKDPDEFVQAHGPEAFRQLLAGAVPLIEFKIRLALDRHPGHSAEARAAAVREVVPILASIQEEARRHEYIRLVATRLLADRTSASNEAYSEASLLAQVESYLRQQAAESYARRPWGRPGDWGRGEAGRPGNMDRNNWNNIKVLGADPILAHERALIRLLVLHPRLLPRAQAELTGYTWAAAAHAAIYAALQELGPGENAGARLVAALDDPAARALVAELQEEALLVMQPERELEDTLKSIRRERDLRRLAELDAYIRQAEAAGRPVDPALLLERSAIVRRTRR